MKIEKRSRPRCRCLWNSPPKDFKGCEIQAIDQHWSLHQLALAWPRGESDDGLASEIAFLGDEPLPQGPRPNPPPSAP